MSAQLWVSKSPEGAGLTSGARRGQRRGGLEVVELFSTYFRKVQEASSAEGSMEGWGLFSAVTDTCECVRKCTSITCTGVPTHVWFVFKP